MKSEYLEGQDLPMGAGEMLGRDLGMQGAPKLGDVVAALPMTALDEAALSDGLDSPNPVEESEPGGMGEYGDMGEEPMIGTWPQPEFEGGEEGMGMEGEMGPPQRGKEEVAMDIANMLREKQMQRQMASAQFQSAEEPPMAGGPYPGSGWMR